MKQNIKILIKRNRLLYFLMYPIIKTRRIRFKKVNSKKQKYYANLFSNVIEGTVKVVLNNIPGKYEIDARSHILKRILMDKKYEPDIVKILLKHLNPNKDAVNVGANIGLFTNLIATNINNQRKVLAIEPTPIAYKLLKSNIDTNGNEGKTILYNGIATDKPGNYNINIIQGNEEYSSIGEMVHPAIKDREFVNIEVHGETVDNLVEKFKLNPGIIVIDVEGAEYSVLIGATNTFKKYSPVIISELDDNLLKTQNRSSYEIISYLEHLNYGITDSSGNKIEFPFSGNIIAISKV